MGVRDTRDKVFQRRAVRTFLMGNTWLELKLVFYTDERATRYSLYICTRAFAPRYGGKLPLTIEI